MAMTISRINLIIKISLDLANYLENLVMYSANMNDPSYVKRDRVVN